MSLMSAMVDAELRRSNQKRQSEEAKRKANKSTCKHCRKEYDNTDIREMVSCLAANHHEPIHTQES